LFLLGQSYESEVNAVRKNTRLNEVVKTRLIEDQTKNAAEAYDRIITRYPAMDRAVDAKARLEALHQPVPRPTRAALELNKKEIASRQEEGILSNVLGTFSKGPDTSKSSRVGDPPLVDPEAMTATQVVNQMSHAAQGGGGENVAVEKINGSVAPNQPTPRSDAPATAPDSAGAAAAAEQPAAAGPSAGGATAELRPTVADPNELKPNIEPETAALPPLQQSNQLEGGTSSSAGSSTPAKTEEMADISSSKKKKKKGLKKLNPF
jgi:outer membrane protein assembly factor BamD